MQLLAVVEWEYSGDATGGEKLATHQKYSDTMNNAFVGGDVSVIIFCRRAECFLLPCRGYVTDTFVDVQVQRTRLPPNVLFSFVKSGSPCESVFYWKRCVK